MIAETISERLKHEGWKVTVVNDGAEVCEAFSRGNYSAVVMDIMLPHVNGVTLVKQIRLVSEVPIIILSALQNPSDEVSILNLGADDYLRKPLRPSVLVAHLKRWLRHTTSNELLINTSSENILQHSNLILDKANVSVFRVEDDGSNTRIDLTMHEFTLLQTLIENADTVVSREEILETAWKKTSNADTRLIDAYIKLLRKKLGKQCIKTNRGQGYTFITNG